MSKIEKGMIQRMKIKNKNLIFIAIIAILVIIIVILSVNLYNSRKKIADLDAGARELAKEYEVLYDGVLDTSAVENVSADEYITFDAKADYDPETDELTEEYWLETYESVLNIFFDTYRLTDNGLTLLFTTDDTFYRAALQLYLDEEDVKEKFKLSNEKTEINGVSYDLYSTGKKFEEYKKELLSLMSEEVFNQYFTTFAKNINGELYIVNQNVDKESEKFEINSIELVSTNVYNVKYTYTDGNNQEQKEIQVTFGRNDDGMAIVKNIEL